MKLHSRQIIRLQGVGADKFLHGLVTQDVIGKVAEHPTKSFAAGFLNAKGRVLCDTIVFPKSPDEMYIDVQEKIAPQLQRMLIRHRLREPLEINIAEDLNIRWDKEVTVSSSSSSTTDDDDPRNSYLGKRFLISKEDGMSLPQGDEEFFKRRLLCGVPEGPVEIPPQKALPLNFNFDINNFVSFRKGCYVGQELTHRSFHVGKIRKRLCRVIKTTQEFADDLPIPEDLIDPEQSIPLEQDEDNEIFEPIDESEWRSCGQIIITHHNIGLAIFSTLKSSLNDHTNVKKVIHGKRFYRGEELILKSPLITTQ